MQLRRKTRSCMTAALFCASVPLHKDAACSFETGSWTDGDVESSLFRRKNLWRKDADMRYVVRRVPARTDDDAARVQNEVNVLVVSLPPNKPVVLQRRGKLCLSRIPPGNGQTWSTRLWIQGIEGVSLLEQEGTTEGRRLWEHI